MKFDGERPTDWPDWVIRMHIWSEGIQIKLTKESGITFEEVDMGAEGIQLIPVFEIDAATTEQFRGHMNPIQYAVDLAAPDDISTMYFTGNIELLMSPPAGMLG
ncbi:hypothetical protein KXR64_16775 [Brucella intermedia]|uniref:hypothetical protein n=1 Tax=Brucella TaxID=234 RepID=UPI00111532E0|nr:hypothetical protein [Brucella intermedia]